MGPFEGRPTVIERLSKSHDFHDFDCDDPGIADEVNGFIRSKALAEMEADLSQTYVLRFYGDQKVRAFITLLMGQVVTSEVAIGALNVAYLARDKSVAGKNWGECLLTWAAEQAITLSRFVGCRGLMLACYEDKREYYIRQKFEEIGTGFDEEYRKKIFHMFRELRRSRPTVEAPALTASEGLARFPTELEASIPENPAARPATPAKTPGLPSASGIGAAPPPPGEGSRRRATPRDP